MTSASEKKARESPQPPARSRRAPDPTAPARAGVGGAGSCAFRTRPGLTASSLLGPEAGVSPPPTPCAGVLTPCCPGATPSAGLHPSPTSPESPAVSDRNGVPSRKRLPAVLRWPQREGQGCCLAAPPRQGGEKGFLGSPRSWRQAASSAGHWRGLAASQFTAPFSELNRVSK